MSLLPDQLGSDSLILFFFLILLLAIFMSLADSFRRRAKISTRPPPTKTELICPSCNLREIRDYKVGDYISKKTDEKCRSCKGDLVIQGIYTIYKGKD